MDRNEFAKKYNLDLAQDDVTIVFYPMEEIEDILVYFPEKHKPSHEENQPVSEYVSILPKSEIEKVNALFPHADIKVSTRQEEVIATRFEDNKQKYLDIEVVFKGDRFEIVASNGGWSNIKKVERKQDAKDVSREQSQIVAESKYTDLRIRTANAERVVLKKTSSKLLSKFKSFEK